MWIIAPCRSGIERSFCPPPLYIYSVDPYEAGHRCTAEGGEAWLTTAALRRTVSPLDPLAFAVPALAWILTSMIASYISSRRAMKIDPLVALRYE